MMTWKELKQAMDEAGVPDNARMSINVNDMEGWSFDGAKVEFTDDESGPSVEIKLL